MSYQMVFKRYELKYILTLAQRARLMSVMAPYMALDDYGRTSIRNIYYDTDTYRLVRHSIEQPAYKEKLRIRSYGQAGPESPVFVELKKKYDSVVYKRRLCMTEKQAAEWMNGAERPIERTQISDEIDYFLSFYKPLEPKAYISYEREAFYSRSGDDLRITLDDHLLVRQSDLSLVAGVWGSPLLAENQVLMEVKCSAGMPLWLSRFLSQEHIYKASFSKYGAAYQTIIYPKMQEESHYARRAV